MNPLNTLLLVWNPFVIIHTPYFAATEDAVAIALSIRAFLID